LNIQPVKAIGMIYIRAGGSVDPPTAPIERDGDVYTLTDNITTMHAYHIYTCGIVIERDNMTLDGAGYILQGTGIEKGINLTGKSNVTIKNTEIKYFWVGILLEESSNNIIHGNNITNNWYGIRLQYVSSNNIIYHNNFIDNTQQVDSQTSGYTNFWDDGYPSGGNYWSDYEEKYPNATELDGSGIWDTPYVIDENNQDNYPLTNPWIPEEEVPFWMQWWLWAIVAIGIVALHGAVYLRKRKPPTPTAPTPPTEGTLQNIHRAYRWYLHSSEQTCVVGSIHWINNTVSCSCYISGIC
jgi:parallel beta-helix repeat protein